MINAGVLPIMASLLCHAKNNIQKEACWMISNITAGNVAQIDSVVKADLLGPLIAVMSKVGLLFLPLPQNGMKSSCSFFPPKE